ncbi:MAG: nuclear transport factor 2 family protein, partial [Acidimicrobiia bacterium]|nr:nuclear transport factor 2 family protein [Acidimicrobiia bacterium]
VLVLSEEGLICEYTSDGHTEEGGSVQIVVLGLNQWDGDGRLCRSEWYAPEQVDEALARFDELISPERPPEPRRRLRPNLATTAAAVISGPLDAARLEATVAAVAEDYVYVDHRMHFEMDRAQWVESLRRLAAGGRGTWNNEPIATLGDRHALLRSSYRVGDPPSSTSTGPIEDALLQVVRVGADGRATRTEMFDVGDLNLAVARLVELHAEDELPADRRADREAMATVFRNRRARWSDDADLIDRRPALHGRDAIRSAGAALRDLSGDMGWRITEVLGFDERVSLIEHVSEGHAADGGLVEIPVLALSVAGDDGLLHRCEWYLPEQIDEALTRFDELTAPAAADYLDNEALRGARRSWGWIVSGDWDNLAAITAPDAVIDDRRRLSQFRAEGHGAVSAHARSIAGAGVVAVEVTPLATRGERLVLTRELARGPDAETEVLDVWEFGAEGSFRGGTVFDPENLDAAFAELDARYAAGEAAPFSDAWAAVTAAVRGFNARDWQALRESSTDDFGYVDHRPVGIGSHDGEGYLRSLRALVELAPDVTLRTLAVLRASDTAVLCVQQRSGSNTSGGDVEAHTISVWAVRDGRLSRFEVYPTENRQEAMQRFDELSGSTPVDHLANTATRGVSLWFERVLADDWDAFAAAVAPNAVFDDRRRMVANRHEGRAAVVSYARSVRTAGVTEVDAVPLATRGDRLAMFAHVFRGASGELDCVAIYEFDSAGRCLEVLAFDLVDLDAAFAELDARYLAGEAAPFAEAWATGTTMF